MQIAPPLQTGAPILVTHPVSPSIPARWRSPGKPVSLAHALAWVTAVNAVTSTIVAMISTNDEDNTDKNCFFTGVSLGILEPSISSAEESVKVFSVNLPL